MADAPRGEVGPVFVGLDAATKKDCAAAVAVTKEGDRVRLVAHRIWKPGPGNPIDLEHVEEYLKELARRYKIAAVWLRPLSAGALRRGPPRGRAADGGARRRRRAT